jgi:FKBP-type peptidyl-prolyl cis-trans isomerase
MRSLLSYFLVVTVALSSCNNERKPVSPDKKPGKNEMAGMNSYLVQKDRERIQNYIERKNLNMTESPTGLWYMIIDEGNGKLFSDNDKIIMEYSCCLLDGTLCYSSEDLGPKEIILGKSLMEAGLNEGLRMLRPGARATFILPPFLAHGFVGDRKKIPPRSIIVYNVTILHNQ